MAPVVAGARLGESADALGSGRARPDHGRPGAAIRAPNKVSVDPPTNCNAAVSSTRGRGRRAGPGISRTGSGRVCRVFRAKCDERGVHIQREEIVEGGMVTGSLYPREKGTDLFFALCRTPPSPLHAHAELAVDLINKPLASSELPALQGLSNERQL